ncbi:MAG: SusC/RagA family TonB-linked outer membrane protein [Chitinophaga sp.]|uniref:SusC/RagA family TonB-linked outer membrane protein n=1 Tax=Chitinophaga sp. TaxID=1869181 RepID=UPI001B00F83D|nr:SusC/RagA family TonB-linked outer membrane protein [Chitinophaga sp.]MBO9730666.1 SusC/RagA family TonB-linked outer membrane protein [Chitinophaga sp.]
MKLSVILLLVGALHVSATAFSQKVTLTGQRLSLQQAFKKIEEQTGYLFLYKKNVIAAGNPVNVNMKDAPLNDALTAIFQGQPLDYVVMEKNILVKLKMPERATLLAMADTTTKSVSGSVRDAKGRPIPGVSIRVKGKATGAISNPDGNFTVNNVADDAVLMFRALGFTASETATKGRNNLNIVLQEDESKLNEVVVTGFGEERKKRSLGYAVTEIKGEDITRANSVNPIAALQGLVPGLQVTPGNGGPQATPRFLIRGSSSLDAFRNTPLIVVDGIVMDDQVVLPNRGGEQDFGNILKNINPDDIASISVLKGGAVTALYGNRAANGVILITSKKGYSKKGLGVSFNHTESYDKPYATIAYQNRFGSGTSPENFIAPGPDGIKGIDPNTYGFGYGPEMKGEPIKDINGMIIKNVPLNVLSLYRTGKFINSNLAVEGGNEVTTFRFSYSNNSSAGTTPKNDFKRNSFNLRATHRLSKSILLDANVAYVRSNAYNPNYASGDNNMIYNLAFGIPRNYNLDYWRNHYIDSVNGGINKNDPVGNSSIWFTLNKDNQRQIEDNYRGNLTSKINLTPWLTFESSTGVNLYSTSYDQMKLGRDSAFSGPAGYYYTSLKRILQTRLKGNLNFNKQINAFDLFLQVGAELNNSETKSNVGYTRNGLKIPMVYRLSNSVDDPYAEEGSPNKYQTVSGFFQGSVSWKDMLTLNIYGRNDWNSTLLYPDGHGDYSYFYPGADLAWIFTEAFKLPEYVTYGKLRASYIIAGNGTTVYTTNTGAYVTNPNYNDPYGNSIERYNFQSSTLGNLHLKPERSYKMEFGTELKFFQNRLGADLTYYKQNTKNQIIALKVPSESGVENALINSGNVQNQGIELALYGSPVKNKNFSWDVYFNYTRNRSKIIDLAPGVDKVGLEGDDGIRTVAIRGGEYGTMVAAYGYARYQAKDADGKPVNSVLNGKPVLKANGVFLRQTDNPNATDKEAVIGSSVPKFMGSLRNTFNYKSFSLSFLLDSKFGGYVYSNSYNYGSQVGMLENTLPGRTKDLGGIEFKDAAGVTRTDGIIPDGVFADGTVRLGIDGQNHNVGGMTYQEAYDKGIVRPLRAYAYYNNAFSWFAGIRERSAHESSWVSLRDASLSYDLPARFASKIKFNGLRLTVGGRNLMYLYNSLPDKVNPEDYISSGSGAAFLGGGTPLSRTMYFTVNASF